MKGKSILRRIISLACASALLFTGVVFDGATEVKAGEKPTVYLVGDSTVCAFTDTYYYPRYGYGTQLGNYLDGTYEINNLALSGRSSLSFLKEANYTTLKNNIQAGDVLIIGFGHNDEKAEADRYTNPNGDYTTEGSFAKTLYDNYVKVAKDAGAEVILCTPIVRRNTQDTLSDSNKHITTTTTADGVTYEGGDYAQAIRKLGTDVNVPVADLTSLTAELYESIGAAETLYLHTWTSKKETSVDNTHLNIYGAKKVAYILANAIKSLDTTLASHVNLGTEPTKEADLKANPDYVEPTYNNNLKDSTIFKDFGIFKGTAFGNIGGASKVSNFTIEEVDGKAHFKCQANGKVEANSDGIAMYYYKIPADSIFTFKATATVNTLNANNQAVFGIMARDDMYIDEFISNLASDYVAAGTFGTGNINCFYRKDGVLTKGSTFKTETLAAGNSYELMIESNSDGYACTFGKEETQSGGFDFKLTSIDSDYVYIGMFANRGMEVTFSDISLVVDGKEIDVTKPADDSGNTDPGTEDPGTEDPGKEDPKPENDGWVTEDGVKYWYEDGVKQGTEGRGKEIYDSASDAWYWLDAPDGKVAVSKDVYQESDAGEFGDKIDENGNRVGKWVRYDADGHMIKGWCAGTGKDAVAISSPAEAAAGADVYYFDPVFGAMVKGYYTIEGTEYFFNVATGVLEKTVEGVKDLTGWKNVDGVDIWYENGVRQGVSKDASYRGKEIFDPGTNAWYWLDNVDGGKKAVSKDVYQESLAGDWGDKTNEAGEKIGKWVRYDAQGHMIKGWCAGRDADAKAISSPADAVNGAVYYFDPVFGTMAKGVATIDGVTYTFDTNTGVLVR